MDIFPFMYIFLQLILLSILLFVKANAKIYVVNSIATLNMVLFFNGIYLARKLIGLIQFFRPILSQSNDIHLSTSVFIEPTLRLAGMVFLPFVFLHPLVRKNIVVTILICFYMVFNYTPNYISELDTIQKSLFCTSVFTATYALLWLFQQLPSQTIVE